MTTLAPPIEIRRLGRVEYADGLAMQQRIADAVAKKTARDTFLLLEHNDVLTLGRGASLKAGPAIAEYANILFPPAELARLDVELHETNRGGDVTFHGIGQVVGYPILDLARSAETKDVRKFVRGLEEIMIRTCADFGVQATRDPEHTGVWVGKKKIGAIGVRISRWITSHGFALNVSTDLSRFDLIVPCGIRDRGVTSISIESGSAVRLADVEDRIESHAGDVFGRDLARRDVDQTTVAVAVRRGDEALCLRRVAPDSLCGLPASPNPFWQIITGRLERGETPMQAAQRELREETGFEARVSALGYEHAFSMDSPDLVLGREIVFVADVPAGAEPALSDEHDDSRWCTLGDAIGLVRHAGHRRALRLSLPSRVDATAIAR